jgi:hypothetical protein
VTDLPLNEQSVKEFMQSESEIRRCLETEGGIILIREWRILEARWMELLLLNPEELLSKHKLTHEQVRCMINALRALLHICLEPTRQVSEMYRRQSEMAEHREG